MKACGQAIELNGVLIKPDQMAYHEDLKERYYDLKHKVAVYAGEVGTELRVCRQISLLILSQFKRID